MVLGSLVMSLWLAVDGHSGKQASDLVGKPLRTRCEPGGGRLELLLWFTAQSLKGRLDTLHDR